MQAIIGRLNCSLHLLNRDYNRMTNPLKWVNRRASSPPKKVVVSLDKSKYTAGKVVVNWRCECWNVRINKHESRFHPYFKWKLWTRNAVTMQNSSVLDYVGLRILSIGQWSSWWAQGSSYDFHFCLWLSQGPRFKLRCGNTNLPTGVSLALSDHEFFWNTRT